MGQRIFSLLKNQFELETQTDEGSTIANRHQRTTISAPAPKAFGLLPFLEGSVTEDAWEFLASSPPYGLGARKFKFTE